MNYQIIKDKQKLLEFIDWLPDLEDNQKFYVQLLARRKYCSSLPKDKIKLKRFVSTKEFLFRKIKQLECPIGSYTDDDYIIPQESLVLYITPNPRDIVKANKLFFKTAIGDLVDDKLNYNLASKYLSCLHKCPIRNKFVLDFDIDDKNIDLSKLNDAINNEALSIVETRGGYHVMVHVDKITDNYKNTWFNTIKSIFKVDVSGDCLLPVVGCTQGDFIPKFK